MSNLSELERLTRAESATLRITVDRGQTRASFKRPRQRAIVVGDMSRGRFPLNPAEAILETLLERLGYTGSPTNDLFIEKMNPAQRQRCRELISELQRLRVEVLDAPPPSAYEPHLAPPRSSLHPQIVQGAPEPRPAAVRKNELRSARRKR